MDTILVTTDLSESSKEAFGVAKERVNWQKGQRRAGSRRPAFLS